MYFCNCFWKKNQINYISGLGNKIKINILSYTFNENTHEQSSLVKNDFDEYAEKNNLNIEIEVEMTKFVNPSDSYTGFKTLVESFLKKSNNITSTNDGKHFDMFMFNNKYTNIYGPYLLDLKKHLPEEFLEMYDSKIVKESCTYENKYDKTEELVGLVILINNNNNNNNKIIIIIYNNKIL